MKLKLKAPKIVERKASEALSKSASKELNGDCRIQLKDVELGMKDKRVYAHMTLDAEMDRSDFVRFVEMVMEGS